MQIIDLSSKLNQKENENEMLQDELKSLKADKDQIDVLKQKANQSDILQSKLSEANKKIESAEMTNQLLLQRKSELEMSLSNEEILREDNNTKQNLIDELQVSIKGKDQKISELENKITQKDSKIDALENKMTILESFKAKAINFMSKISSLIPNFSSLLDNEPPEIKNEIKSRMYSGSGIDM